MQSQPYHSEKSTAERKSVLATLAVAMALANAAVLTTFLPRMQGNSALHDTWQGLPAPKLVAPAIFNSTRWAVQPPVTAPTTSQQGSFILSPLLAAGPEARP